MIKKVLIIEDNERNKKLFKFLIESIGIDVLTAPNGEEGIRLAREQAPDLILMDIQMPVMDGVTALRFLKKSESTADIPVVALTSYAMDSERDKYIKEGFTSYITKPIDKDDFLSQIKRLLERKPQ